MLKYNYLRIFDICPKSSICLKSRMCSKNHTCPENWANSNIFIAKRDINQQIHKVDDKQIYPEMSVQINEIRKYQNKLFQLYKEQHNKSEQVISELEKLDIKKINKLIEEIDNQQIIRVVDGEKLINSYDPKSNNLEKIENKIKYTSVPTIILGISMFVTTIILIILVTCDIKKYFGPEVEEYFIHALDIFYKIMILSFILSILSILSIFIGICTM